MAFKDWFDYDRVDNGQTYSGDGDSDDYNEEEKESTMTFDITKVNQYTNSDIYMIVPEDGDELRTQEEITSVAQRNTDRTGRTQGIFKLVGYTVQGPPASTVVTIS